MKCIEESKNMDPFQLLLMDFSQAPAEEFRMMAAFAALVMWFKLFYLLRFFFRTAFFVRMILEIAKDMKTFVFVFLLAI